MKKPEALVALTICSIACCEVSSVAQEQFKKLSGAEIRAKFTGMEFTDEVHWDEVYGENGKLIGEEMGTRRVGTWHIEKDMLCTAYGQKIDGNSDLRSSFRIEPGAFHRNQKLAQVCIRSHVAGNMGSR